MALVTESIISESLNTKCITTYCYENHVHIHTKTHKFTHKGLIINDLEAVYDVLKYTWEQTLLEEEPRYCQCLNGSSSDVTLF